MSTFELIFKKPVIVSCRQNNEIVCHNSVTPVTIVTSGWGWLMVRNKLDHDWPGIREYKSINNVQSTYFIPQGKWLQIVMYNCFGRTQLVIDSIRASNELHEIVAPKKADYKTVHFSINRSLNLRAVANRIKNKTQLPRLKITNNLSSDIELQEYKVELTKLKIINNSCRLLVPSISYSNFTNRIRINSVSISNKIETKNITED